MTEQPARREPVMPRRRVLTLLLMIGATGAVSYLDADGAFQPTLALAAANWLVLLVLMLLGGTIAALVQHLHERRQLRRALAGEAGGGYIGAPTAAAESPPRSREPAGAAGRLEIDPRVQTLLTGEELLHAVDAREHTELHCLRCRDLIPPESAESVSLVALLDPMRNNRLLKFAHSRCQRSQILVCDLPLERLGGRTAELAWVAVHRPGARPSAALVWEPWLSGRAAGRDSTIVIDDLYLWGLRRLGFQPAAAGILELETTTRPELRLERVGDELRLRLPDGSVETFAGLHRAAPPAWRAALRSERACLLVAGSNLGLDRATIERIDAAIQARQAVAAVAPLT